MTITYLLHILAALVAAYVTFVSFKDLAASALYLNAFTDLLGKGRYSEIPNLPKNLLIALAAVFGGVLLGLFYDTTLTILLLIVLGFLSTKKEDIIFTKDEVFVLTLTFAVYFAGCILS